MARGLALAFGVSSIGGASSGTASARATAGACAKTGQDFRDYTRRRLRDPSAALARRHANVPMAGRTWLQQATPVSFGLKAAGWLDGLARGTATLRVALDDLLVLQFGGATGTLASMGPSALLVEAELASRLNLSVADTPWHAQRDRLGHLGSALGVAVGIAGKVARDVALLAQSEVGEAWEQGAAGRGRSSTMPQKRNPMGASVALAAAVRVPGLVASLLHALPQEHARGLGGWQAAWDLVPDLGIGAASGAGGVADSLTRLEIDPDRMLANLEARRGLPLAESVSMALAASVGKEEAHHLVARACRRVAEEGRSLAEVLTDDETVAAHLDGDEIRRRLDPRRYLGQSQAFIDRVLARWETKRCPDAERDVRRREPGIRGCRPGRRARLSSTPLARHDAGAMGAAVVGAGQAVSRDAL